MKRFLMSALFAAAMVVGASASAQEGDAARDPDDPTSMAFRAADGAEIEEVDGGALMVASYGVILVLLLGYVLYLARIQAGTSGEISRLRAALVDKTKEPKGKEG